MLPRIRFSDRARAAGDPSPRTLLRASRALARHGVLLLENVFPVKRIVDLHAAYLRCIPTSADRPQWRNGLAVGDRRYMFTLELKAPFNRRELLANRFVLPILRRFLDKDLVLSSFGVVVAFPGADEQHVHRDAAHLFPEDRALSAHLPAYALTVVIPLADLTRENGATRVWPGSQAAPKRPPAGPSELVLAPRGSCFLMDYRIFHGGTRNASREIRPILYVTYSRPWFRDPNYVQQPGIFVRPKTLRAMPAECRRLLRLASPDDPPVPAVETR